MLGSSSFVGVLTGVVAAKFRAVLLGTSGYGLSSLQASVIAIGAILAGAGISAGVVKIGAQAIAAGEPGAFDRLRQGAWLAVAPVALLVGAATLIVLHTSAARLLLGGPAEPFVPEMLAAALFLNVLAGIQTGVLSALQEVKALVRVAIINSVLGGTLSVLAIWAWRESGIAVALLATAVVTFLSNVVYVRLKAPRQSKWMGARALVKPGSDLLRFGMPYAASMLASTGVTAFLPFVVLHELDLGNVGLFRASSRIAVVYLALFSTAMAQSYYPRVSTAVNDHVRLSAIMDEQYQALMFLCAPVVLLGMGLLPKLLGLFYASGFYGAGELLQWQLAGDLLRLSSWVFSFVVLAACGPRIFLLTELISGATLLATTWVGVRLWGLIGAGIAYVISYAVYFFVVRFFANRRVKATFSWQTKFLFLAALASAGVALSLPGSGPSRMLVCFAASSLLAIPILLKLGRTIRNPKPRVGLSRAPIPQPALAPLEQPPDGDPNATL